MSKKTYDDGLEDAAKWCDRRMEMYLERADTVQRTSIEYTVYSGVATQARICATAFREMKEEAQAEHADRRQ